MINGAVIHRGPRSTKLGLKLFFPIFHKEHPIMIGQFLYFPLKSPKQQPKRTVTTPPYTRKESEMISFINTDDDSSSDSLVVPKVFFLTDFSTFYTFRLKQKIIVRKNVAFLIQMISITIILTILGMIVLQLKVPKVSSGTIMLYWTHQPMKIVMRMITIITILQLKTGLKRENLELLKTVLLRQNLFKVIL